MFTYVKLKKKIYIYIYTCIKFSSIKDNYTVKPP